MKLRTDRIWNFKSFGDAELEIGSLHALVGANNAGKSTVLRAHRPDGPHSDMVERELRRAGLLPSIRVPVRALAAGRDGSIWLQREDTGGESDTWQVLARDGEVAGMVRLCDIGPWTLGVATRTKGREVRERRVE